VVNMGVSCGEEGRLRPYVPGRKKNSQNRRAHRASRRKGEASQQSPGEEQIVKRQQWSCSEVLEDTSVAQEREERLHKRLGKMWRGERRRVEEI